MSAPLLRTIACIMIVLFGTDTLFAPVGYAQVAFLPAAGTMVPMTGKFNPVVIKGMQLYPDNPFKFDFIVDTGDTTLSQEQLKEQGQKLISYFLASLTTPEKDMWVNLSPYEKDRIIPTAFGDTEMGKELLSQDYLLKQIMATALYPQRELGRQFWQKVYSEAKAKFGTTNVPVNTFNKVWILPDKAVVYENSRMNSVFVVESSLKVMLDQDYLATKKNANVIPAKAGIQDISAIGSQIIRAIVIPALQKEVNEGRNFAPLRQVYQSLILAAWYKKNLKNNVIAQAYVDRNKTKGVDVADKNITQKIYKQYLQAYRKGVYNFIKEDLDPATQTEVPRKYFSGGLVMAVSQAMTSTTNPAMAASLTRNRHLKMISAGAEFANGQEATHPLANMRPEDIEHNRKVAKVTLVSIAAVAAFFTVAAIAGVNFSPPVDHLVQSKNMAHFADRAMNTAQRVVAVLGVALVAISVVTSVNIDAYRGSSVEKYVAGGSLWLTLLALELGKGEDEMLHGAISKVQGAYYETQQAYSWFIGENPAAVKAATRDQNGLTQQSKIESTPTFNDRWPESKAPVDQAMKGGINLEKVDVNTRGGGVRTAFSDPEQLKRLLKADGLVAVIYKIQPLTVAMMDMLLGIPSP